MDEYHFYNECDAVIDPHNKYRSRHICGKYLNNFRKLPRLQVRDSISETVG